MAERGMGRLFKFPGSSNWWIQFSYRGTKHRESSRSPKRSVAVALLKARIAEMQGGQFAGTGAARVSVAMLLDNLEADYRLHGRASLRNLRGHRAALLEYLEGVRAVDVTTARLNRMAVAWREEQKAPATVNRYFETLRRAFVLGKKATPPLVQFVPDVPSLPEHNVRTGYVDHAVVPKLLAALEHDPPLRDYIEWLAFTGMRRGAARDLRWQDIDRKHGTMRLPAEIEKTRRSRSLPLPAPLLAIVARRWTARTEYAKQTGTLVPWVFWRVYDGAPREGLARGDAVRIVDFRKAFTRACKAADCPGLLVHDFRRTAARSLRLAGVDREQARLVTGHRTDAMFSRYNIDDDLQLRDAMEKLTAYVTAERAKVARSDRVGAESAASRAEEQP
jgi:integrase